MENKKIKGYWLTSLNSDYQIYTYDPKDDESGIVRFFKTLTEAKTEARKLIADDRNELVEQLAYINAWKKKGR